MIADGFTEGNEGNQELRYLCELLFKKSANNYVAMFKNQGERQHYRIKENGLVGT